MEVLHTRGTETLDGFREQGNLRVAEGAGSAAKVEIAESGSIPRTDFEARRVLDDHDLFRILSAQLEA